MVLQALETARIPLEEDDEDVTFAAAEGVDVGAAVTEVEKLIIVEVAACMDEPAGADELPTLIIVALLWDSTKKPGLLRAVPK